MSLFIIRLEFLNGWPHSTVLFIFWLLLIMTSTIALRSKIIAQLFETTTKKSTTPPPINLYEMIVFYLKFFMILTSLVLSTLSQPGHKHTSFKRTRRAPEQNSPLLSMLTFWWVNALINTGFKRDLTRDDLWEIDDSEKSSWATSKLESVWSPKAQKFVFFYPIGIFRKDFIIVY